MSLNKMQNRLRMRRSRERAPRAPGKEGKEATVLVSLRLPITLVGRIERLTLEAVAKGTYPWRSKNAAYKSIIVAGLKTLKGTSDTVDEFLPYLEVRASLDQIGSARVDAEALLAKSRTELSSLLDVDARTQAIQYFHTVRSAAERMPPTVYRDWLIATLNREFKDLAKSKPQGVTLVKGHRRHLV